MTRRILPLLCAALLAMPFTACSEEHQAPPSLDQGGDDENDKPVDPGDGPASGKEKMLWFDAEANFQRFSTKEGITAMLDKTVEAGFNKIVVDVKPVEGDVLYASDFMTQATTIGSVTVPARGWDYLQFFLDEAHKRGLEGHRLHDDLPDGHALDAAGARLSRQQMERQDLPAKQAQGGRRQPTTDIKDDPTKVAAFLNPVLPEVREFALRLHPRDRLQIRLRRLCARLLPLPGQPERLLGGVETGLRGTTSRAASRRGPTTCTPTTRTAASSQAPTTSSGGSSARWSSATSWPPCGRRSRPSNPT